MSNFYFQPIVSDLKVAQWSFGCRHEGQGVEDLKPLRPDIIKQLAFPFSHWIEQSVSSDKPQSSSAHKPSYISSRQLISSQPTSADGSADSFYAFNWRNLKAGPRQLIAQLIPLYAFNWQISYTAPYLDSVYLPLLLPLYILQPTSTTFSVWFKQCHADVIVACSVLVCGLCSACKHMKRQGAPRTEPYPQI